MANPFFSGRIPSSLAEKIDAHLLVIGETRSELLIRLLRAEVADNKPDNSIDNKSDNLLFDLLSRVEKLELAANNKGDNTVDNKPNNKADNTMKLTWQEFCDLIDEPLPVSRTKTSADKLIKAGLAKGRKGWQYNSKDKRFNPDPQSVMISP
jgi:hypothetical protein